MKDNLLFAFFVCFSKLIFAIDTVEYNIGDTSFVYSVVNEIDEENDTIYSIRDIHKLERSVCHVYRDTSCFSLVHTSYWKNDSLISENYFENNRLKRRVILKDGYDLIFEEAYCPNGQLKLQANYNGQLIAVIHFYCSGKPKKKFNIRNFDFFGDYLEWFDNGNLKVTGKYGENGNKTGRWLYFYEDGLLDKEENYPTSN